MTIVGQKWPPPRWFLQKSVPTIAPSIVVQDAGQNTQFASDLAVLNSVITTNDSDGFTTTEVKVYESNVLIGSATLDSPGNWHLSLGKVAAADKIYTAQRITAQGSVFSNPWYIEVSNPGRIFSPLGAAFVRWLRGTNTTVVSGNVTQVQDLSGSGHNAAGTETPLYIAADSAANGQAGWQSNGTATHGRLDDTGWVRSIPLWIATITRQDLSISGRILRGDTVANTFRIAQANTLGRLVMRNAASDANSNDGGVVGQVNIIEAYFSGSLSTDYLRVKSLIANNQNAGSNTGANERAHADPTGGARISATEFEEVVCAQLPTLLMLSKFVAYGISAYGTTLV